jgi:hypothetical protein
MTKTLRQIRNENGRAILDGKVWTVGHVNLDGRTIDLDRDVKVKAHFRRLSNYQASGWRRVTIRRPADTMAEMV